MIKVITKGGRMYEWQKSEYVCQYDKKAILIFKNGEMVALYNLDSVAEVLIE